jgi:sn1-specific diacylglycerol lipase
MLISHTLTNQGSLWSSGSRIRVTSEVTFPGNYGQIIAADIGIAPGRAQSIFHHGESSQPTKFATQKHLKSKQHPHIQTFQAPARLGNTELKSTLRRLSKMVLAGYGGASLLFFGVPLTSTSAPPQRGSVQAKSEESQLAQAIDAAEAEAAGDGELPAGAAVNAPTAFSWWDVLLGKHDHEIFEGYADSHRTISKGKNEGKVGKGGKHMDVRIGREHLMPRFWVLTDHGRSQVVLVLRGGIFFFAILLFAFWRC